MNMHSLRTPWKLLFGKLILATLFFTVAMSSPRIVHSASFSQTQEPAEQSVRLLVKRDPALDNQGQISVLSAVDADDTMLAEVGWEVIEVDAAAAPAIMAQLQATQGILEVTPDYPLELAW